MVWSFKTHTHTRTACTAAGKSSATLDTRGIQEDEKRERGRDREGEGGRGREERKDTRGKQGSDAGASRCLDYRNQQELRLQGGRRPRSSCSSGRRQAGAPCPLPLWHTLRGPQHYSRAICPSPAADISRDAMQGCNQVWILRVMRRLPACASCDHCLWSTPARATLATRHSLWLQSLGLLRESRVLKLYSVAVRPQAELHQWRPTHDNHHASVAPTAMGGYHLNWVKRWTRSCTISSVKVRIRGEHSVRWARVTRGKLIRMCLCHPRRGFGKQIMQARIGRLGWLEWFFQGCGLLLIDKARAKDKTYIWVSVRWKTKN